MHGKTGSWMLAGNLTVCLSPGCNESNVGCRVARARAAWWRDLGLDAGGGCSAKMSEHRVFILGFLVTDGYRLDGYRWVTGNVRVAMGVLIVDRGQNRSK